MSKRMFNLIAWLIGVGLVALLIASAWGINYVGVWWDCSRYSNATERQYKIEWGECFIKTDRGWFAKSQLRSAE